jgi:uncharacterized protein
MGRLSLKVVPGSSRDEIVGWLGDSLKVKVKAPPEKGRANEAVVALLAERLGTDASSIAVVSGHSSPAIDIHSLSPLPLARSRQSRRAAGLGTTLRRSQKKATPGG